MKPILYSPTETTFAHNGIGVLTDCVSCVVTEERNGAFELEMAYPVDGAFYTSIVVDAIIKAKPNETKGDQLFRVYSVSRPINCIVTVSAEHISYQLSHIPVSPFSSNSLADALAKVKGGSVGNNPFSFSTSMSSTAAMSISVPSSCRSCLLGSEGSILDVYGGEYEWDNYNVLLHRQRGADNGVVICYGKNLIDLTQEESIADVVTGIYPYWTGGEGDLVQLPEKVVQVQSAYSYPRIQAVDMTQEFDGKPTAEQLREKANEFISRSGIGTPKVCLTVDFVQLWQTAGYEDIAGLERVGLCDTVTVRFDRLGVDAKAKVNKTVYDCLAERYEKIELGDSISNITDTILAQETEIKAAPSLSIVEQAIQTATAAITGASGGYVVLSPSENPQEILIMNTPNINTATKVWRWNSGGLGYSGNGYGGPYDTAITMDGQIVGRFIAALTIAGNQIISGRIQSPTKPEVYFDLDGGVMACNELVSSTNSSTKIKITVGKSDDNLRDEVHIFYGTERVIRINPEGNGNLEIQFSNGYSVMLWDAGWMGFYTPAGGTSIMIRNDKIEFGLPVYDRNGKEIKGA